MRAIKPSPAAGPDSKSDWRERFRFDHVKVLIVGRGPIRLEAVKAFDGLGAQPTGILLSEKDSVVYPRALAPELRAVGRNERVHRIPDYGSTGGGADGGERAQRIGQILDIARDGGYTHLFAGYGFMAEEHDFIGAVEEAGLRFVGPSSAVARRAGAKDAAKTLARQLGVSVTPGLDNVAALALLSKAGGKAPERYLEKLAAKHGLAPAEVSGGRPPPGGAEKEADGSAEALAGRMLEAAQAKGVELVTVAELQAEAGRRAARLFRENPGMRLRLKHVAGGGGKGQRIVSAPEQTADAVFQVLSEATALGPGDNRNFLIELNVEETRHNEIQLLGNGDWCVALGGRDCSLQMHEQKLLEVSITREMLEAAAAEYQAEDRASEAAVLRADLTTLEEMEQQAELFGRAVGLDSASTFESIVQGRRHYFMEINTRIQVEHRVTEMVYGLRFSNPERPEESFQVDSLVEAMLWVAVHGAALPRPERIPRHGSGAEVRINATNDALRPHSGGVVLGWSPPIEHELRDDQGIGIPNPDTGTFMPYHLAGAYDSNACLVVSHGESRLRNFERLAEILRRMEIRGEDVMTNQVFHYGLLNWILGADAMVKPDTRFVRHYLAAVGALRGACGDVELDVAWEALMARASAQEGGAAEALAAKTTLVLRPLKRLYGQPHLLAGWLAPRPRRRRWTVERGRVRWHRNPLEVLDSLYRYLRLEAHPGVSPDEQIWEQDRRLLERALAFYADLRARLRNPGWKQGGKESGRKATPGGEAHEPAWPELRELLEKERPPKGFGEALWGEARAAHHGFQIGLELLELPVLSGEAAGFYGLKVNRKLEPVVPREFRDERLVEQYHAALAPPPPVSSGEIVAWSGGTFYPSPAPGEPPYVREGSRFEAGDVVGLLEVMKMFNPVRAEFAGTITKSLIPGDSGVIVRKGQPLFEVRADAPLEAEDEQEARARREEKTRALVEALFTGR